MRQLPIHRRSILDNCRNKSSTGRKALAANECLVIVPDDGTCVQAYALQFSRWQSDPSLTHSSGDLNLNARHSFRYESS
jgi:hypothetical protein